MYKEKTKKEKDTASTKNIYIKPSILISGGGGLWSSGRLGYLLGYLRCESREVSSSGLPLSFPVSMMTRAQSTKFRQGPQHDTSGSELIKVHTVTTLTIEELRGSFQKCT